jgi:hypothetical protein
MASVIPKARIALMDICCARSIRLGTVRNLPCGTVNEKKVVSTTRAKSNGSNLRKEFIINYL